MTCNSLSNNAFLLPNLHKGNSQKFRAIETCLESKHSFLTDYFEGDNGK